MRDEITIYTILYDRENHSQPVGGREGKDGKRRSQIDGKKMGL